MSKAEVLRRAYIVPVDVFIRAAKLIRFGHAVRMPEQRVFFCTGFISMAESQGAGLARTGCAESLRMQLREVQKSKTLSNN